MLVLGLKSSLVMAMLHSSSSIEGTAAYAMAVLFFSPRFWMIGPCSGKLG